MLKIIQRILVILNFTNINSMVVPVAAAIIFSKGKVLIARRASHKHLAGFWEFPGGKMQVPRVSWDSKAKKWFHQYGGQKINSHDWMHLTGNSQNWNTMC